ncbi:MAG: carbohydrate-binding family 9-like protein [Planctomycetes bacterium]|nr:carbohydrate-binding family 9-like protein [Planctomycetota bacterium]
MTLYRAGSRWSMRLLLVGFLLQISIGRDVRALGTEFDDLLGWGVSAGQGKIRRGVLSLSRAKGQDYAEVRANLTLDLDQFPVLEVGCLRGEYGVLVADVHGLKDDPNFIAIGGPQSKGPSRFKIQEATGWTGRRNVFLALRASKSAEIDYVRFVARGDGVARAWPKPPIPRYEVRRTAGPLVIDGKLDEASWTRCEPMSANFVLVDGQVPGHPPTVAKMLWDDENLYLAVKCQDDDLYATKPERDDNLWEEDVVELFITVPNDPKYFIEFEVSPMGTLMDIFNLRAYGGVINWDCPRWKCAVSADGTVGDRTDVDRGWTVEMALPLLDCYAQPYAAGRAKELEAQWQAREVKRENDPKFQYNHRPSPGDIWRLNVYRIDCGPAHTEYQAWSPPIVLGFHVPDRFGEAVFSAETAGTR